MLPEEEYVTALLEDLNTHLPLIENRSVMSLFFGGGTPSLFSGKSIEQILKWHCQALVLGSCSKLEITLEANPGTIDQARFADFRQAGVNRLSLGIQSLEDDKLKALGRIHDRAKALEGIAIAKKAGFTNFNLDIMYGLPQQSIEDALCKSDIQDCASGFWTSRTFSLVSVNHRAQYTFLSSNTQVTSR